MGLSSNEEDGGDQRIRAIRDAALRGASSARGPDDAEDAAQDAVIEMIVSGEEYNDPKAFAYRAGRRRGIDLGRRGVTRKRAEERFGALPTSAAPSPENAVIASMFAKVLMERARSDLTPAEFAAFMALYYDGGNFTDAARFLASKTGRSAATIRTQLRRAAEKLREAVEDE